MSDELLTIEVVRRRLWEWAFELSPTPESQLLRRAATLLDEYELLLNNKPANTYAEIERLRAAIKKAGVMIGQGYSRTSVSDHLQRALANEQKPDFKFDDAGNETTASDY